MQVDRHVDALAGDYVGVDNAAGVRAMLEYVVSLSCKDVVFVSETGASSTGRSRLAAFELGVGKVDGLTPRPRSLGASPSASGATRYVSCSPAARSRTRSSWAWTSVPSVPYVNCTTSTSLSPRQ